MEIAEHEVTLVPVNSVIVHSLRMIATK